MNNCFVTLQMAVIATLLTIVCTAQGQDPPVPSTVKSRASGSAPATNKDASVTPSVQPPARRNLNNGRNRRNRNGRTAKSTPRKKVEVKFGSNPEKPVLEMDIVGGYRVKNPDGFEETAVLQIFSDGRVLTGRKSPLVKQVEGQIDLVEVKSLLSFIADDCRFFDLSTESLKKDMTSNPGVQMMDAGTTRFTVNLDKHSNSVEIYALPQAAGKFADVPSVTSMIAIASRCRKLVAETKLGSTEEAEAALVDVNLKAAKQAPNLPKFSLLHLQFAEQFADGRRTATFVQHPDVDGEKALAYATWQRSADGKDSVSLIVSARRF